LTRGYSNNCASRKQKIEIPMKANSETNSRLNTKLISGAVGLALLLAIALLPLLLNLLQPVFGLTIEPPISNLNSVNLAPSLTFPHILGTDALGRDLLKMIAYGALGSLSVGLCSAVVAVTLGNLWGALAALAGEQSIA
jgi:oligopeptide transport system permease protein